MTDKVAKNNGVWKVENDGLENDGLYSVSCNALLTPEI